jgi:hypothetical protein
MRIPESEGISGTRAARGGSSGCVAHGGEFCLAGGQIREKRSPQRTQRAQRKSEGIPLRRQTKERTVSEGRPHKGTRETVEQLRRGLLGAVPFRRETYCFGAREVCRCYSDLRKSKITRLSPCRQGVESLECALLGGRVSRRAFGWNKPIFLFSQNWYF